ncbi:MULTISPECIES: phosphate ABC transporter permease PstA [Stenotrophomonas]|uniref:Phosphate transport system permease protein PstA n=1 Tax=Stenotrophomonas lactitubi TaxID=2045214 RepID=A0AAW4GDJ2_9GAMM|nr:MULTISPECIES: phosphate ABC transporter permease PstA [Stenotrophomonas]MBM9912265.1 phosphate ABC transporter permease PstA [Stenotrophomonas lactitubi]MBM9920697.1 phosphate ABC transporter permease PstA [Stenotrophomonas lactitubi]MBM9937861.1 phosphate ABC transporter permease PstA [Stenotrophomonas lactitubi]
MRNHTTMGLDDGAITRRARLSDLCFTALGLLVLFLTLTILLALVADFVVDGAPRLTPEFFTSFPSRRPESAGILSAWIGTCLVMLVTAILAVPVGVAAGVYLEEYAPKHWITDVIEVNVTNLAGVPSIIFGLLALGLFVQMFGLGQTILVAGMTLALLILPIIIVATRESLRAIPQDIREAAFGLGADQWQTVSGFLLPAARPGILTGAIVGMSRAIGETAPIITIGALTFIAFLPPSPIQASPPFVSFEWLNSPFTVMPIQMFNWVSRPQAGFHLNAAAAGLVLLGMTLLMNGFAIWLRYRLRRRLR